MIPILPDIRNSRSTGSLSSNLLSNRTGSSFWNTINGSMASRLNRFNDGMENPFPMILSALYAGLPTITSTITMGAMDSTSARSVARLFLPVKLLQPLSVLSVLIVVMHWLQKKTGNFSVYTNVWIPNALTTFTTWKRWNKRIWIMTMAKTNISFTTSTVNSLWISLPWT